MSSPKIGQRFKLQNLNELIVYKSPVEKIRIGPKFDGGYVVCCLLGGYDTFISGGIGNNIEFEKHFLSMMPQLSCLAFDGTVSGIPQSVDRLSFIKMNLGETNTSNTTNLLYFMHGVKDAFIKIDIEGNEFKLLPSMIENGDMSKVKQLILEIHTPQDIKLHPKYYGDSLKNITDDIMFNMLKMINKTHSLVHLHGNSSVGSYINDDGVLIPKVIECTFVRKSEFPNFNWTISDENIPSKLDYPNTHNSSEITLKGFPFNSIET